MVTRYVKLVAAPLRVSRSASFGAFDGARLFESDLSEGFRAIDTGWRLTFEWAALQPDRKRLVTPALFVTAAQNGSIEFVARVYADSLPEPLTLEAEMQVVVEKYDVKIADLLEGADSFVSNAASDEGSSLNS